MRKLVTIQKIKSLSPIPDADMIEVAEMESNKWKVVVKKGEFVVGSLCVFFEVDSLVPITPWSQFLEDKNKIGQPARLRTIKLRKQLSQGLCLPTSILPTKDINYFSLVEGLEVTDLLGVTKYEPVIPACLSGDVKGPRPHYTPETDEERIQNCPAIIQEFQGKEVYVTQKMDGTSSTFSYFEGELDVCGRNWSIKEDGSTYWKIAKMYDIPAKLKRIREETGINYGIQGEICGPSIQKNKMGLKDHKLFVFNVIDLNGVKYLDFKEKNDICNALQLPTVPLLYVGEFKWKSVEELLAYAEENKYENGELQEGVVIRPLKYFHSEVLSARASFKAISNAFLLKWDKKD